MGKQGGTPAGWYPNPEGTGQRYWDGSQWTEHYHGAGASRPTPAQAETSANKSALSSGKKLLIVGAAVVGGWGLIGGLGALGGEDDEDAGVPTAEAAKESKPKPKLTVITETGSEVRGNHGYIKGRVAPRSVKLTINDKPVEVVGGKFKHRVRLKAGGNDFRLSATKAGLEDYDFLTLRRKLTPAEERAKRERAEAARLREQQQAERRRLAAQQRQAQARQNFIATATTIPYNQLEKNADEFAGKNVTYRGQIFQIQEDYGSTVILLAVTDEGYGLWTDNIWVDYDGEIDSAEEDVITVHGTVKGEKSYDTQIGGETYVPQIKAKYIEE